MNVKIFLGVLPLASLGWALPTSGQNISTLVIQPNERLPKPDCTTGASTELDFWIGNWKVTRHADGAQFGVNHFTKEIGSCALRENFQAKLPDGSDYLGTSLSYYDQIDRQWHQFYVDNGGRRSVYAGNMKNGDWVMIAPNIWPGRGSYLRRMTVRHNPDGSVR